MEAIRFCADTDILLGGLGLFGGRGEYTAKIKVILKLGWRVFVHLIHFLRATFPVMISQYVISCSCLNWDQMEVIMKRTETFLQRLMSLRMIVQPGYYLFFVFLKL